MGNLDAKRDWGYAPDYVRMMYMMLQQNTPDDYVVATGEMHTVREFIERAFARLGHPVEWRGSAEDEVGVDTVTGKTVIRIDPRYFRPAEVEQLLGDPSKAKRQLGWVPEVKFAQLVDLMVDADLRYLDNPKYERGV